MEQFCLMLLCTILPFSSSKYLKDHPCIIENTIKDERSIRFQTKTRCLTRYHLSPGLSAQVTCDSVRLNEFDGYQQNCNGLVLKVQTGNGIFEEFQICDSTTLKDRSALRLKTLVDRLYMDPGYIDLEVLITERIIPKTSCSITTRKLTNLQVARSFLEKPRIERHLHISKKLDANILNNFSAQCGIVKNKTQIRNRIVGGSEVWPPHNYNWMVVVISNHANGTFTKKFVKSFLPIFIS